MDDFEVVQFTCWPNDIYIKLRVDGNTYSIIKYYQDNKKSFWGQWYLKNHSSRERDQEFDELRQKYNLDLLADMLR